MSFSDVRKLIIFLQCVVNTKPSFDLNARDITECDALMVACFNGHKDIVQLLLHHSESKIDLNARSCLGRTPFIWACKYGHKDIVQLFLEYSNPHIKLNARDNFKPPKAWKKSIKPSSSQA